MPLYICRWENGDFSVVQATTKDHAVEMLDEAANAAGLPLYSIRDFMVHFKLTDDGAIKLEGFGDDFEDHIREQIYPTLSEVEISHLDGEPYDQSKIKAAVEAERNRTKAKTPKQPDTEIGKKMKLEMDLPTVVVNQKVQAAAKEILSKTPTPKGKPN